MFVSSTADWTVYGGAAGGGKTHALTIDPLRHVQGPHAQKAFRGAIFRRLFPEISNPGGLLDHCKELYEPFNGIYNHTSAEFRFPSGSKISLNTIQDEKTLKSYQGAQFDWVAFDEATQFPLKYVKYIWSRCRSKSGIKTRLKMSCNPDNDSWVYRLIFQWINPETGFPKPEMAGVVKHCMMKGDDFTWFDEPQFKPNGTTATTSVTFIPSTLKDNEFLQEKDPDYEKNLEAMDQSEMERYLLGNWLASSKTDVEWPRDLFIGVFIPYEKFPIPKHANDIVRMFAIDASKGKSQKKGDYSAITCIAQTSELKYVDCDMKRRSPSEIVEDLFLFCEQDHHRIRSGDLIGCESLQFQELFLNLIMAYADKNKDYALSKYLRSGNIIIPVQDMLKKELRIRRLDGQITRREFRFLENPGTTLLLSQLRSFDGIPGPGKHDDGPDSLDMAQQLPGHLDRYYEELRKPNK
jgi:hypothetical protein